MSAPTNVLAGLDCDGVEANFCYRYTRRTMRRLCHRSGGQMVRAPAYFAGFRAPIGFANREIDVLTWRSVAWVISCLEKVSSPFHYFFSLLLHYFFPCECFATLNFDLPVLFKESFWWAAEINGFPAPKATIPPTPHNACGSAQELESPCYEADVSIE